MTIKASVPATTANLSCGFDVLGLALDLFYRVWVEETASGFSIHHSGQGEGHLPLNQNNLFFQAVKRVWERIDFPPKGLIVKAENEIPVSRGLGSSAACIVAGVLVANAIAGGVLNEKEMIQLASEIEGHPDNVVPAFLGGFTMSFRQNEQLVYSSHPFFSDIEMVACIPPYPLSTSKMRQVLPLSYPRAEVVFSLSHLAYLVRSVLLKDRLGFFCSLEDRIHEPYRGRYIKGFTEVKSYLESTDRGRAVVSGSGPTVILFLNQPWNQELQKDVADIFRSQGVPSIVLQKVSWVSTGGKIEN